MSRQTISHHLSPSLRLQRGDPEPPILAVAPTAISVNKAAPADGHFSETPVLLARVPTAEIPVGAPLSDEPTPLREMRSLGSLFTSDPVAGPAACRAPG